ncbi:MAG: hypothetical protein WD872_00930 [Pirellulaceae bacterium]
MPLSNGWLGLILLWACGLPLAAAESPALERRLLADAGDGSLDAFTLTSACLIAGGPADAAELEKHERQLDAWSQRLLDGMPTDLAVERRAAAIFAALHREILVGRYDPRASDLGRTLRDGDFNCLTALVLYYEFCRRADVPLEIWSRPGHVYCRLPKSSQRIEPTLRNWLTATQLQATTETRPARRITPVELVGRCYYNRGVELLQRRQFAQGLALLEIARRLDPADTDARANLLAGLNNWALALSARGEHSAADRLIARGLAIDPRFPPLVANARLLRRTQQQSALRAGGD